MAYLCRGLLWWAIQAGLLNTVGADAVNNGAALTRHFLNTSTSATSSSVVVSNTLGSLPALGVSTGSSSSSTSSSQVPSRTWITTIGLGGVVSGLPSVGSEPIPSPTDTISWFTMTPSTESPYVSTLTPNSTLSSSSGRYTNSSSTAFPSSTTRAPYGNTTSAGGISTIFPSPTVPLGFPSRTSESCSTLSYGEAVTIWSFLPNTTTITLTQTGNSTLRFAPTPEFVPPTYCGITVSGARSSMTTSMTSIAESSIPQPWAPFTPRPTTTVITTSKNPVTVITTQPMPNYNGNTDKASATDTSSYSDTYIWSPLPALPSTDWGAGDPYTVVYNGDKSASTPVTQTDAHGVTLIVSPTQVVIGGQTVSIGPGEKTITEGGEVFTINPSQVIGPFIIVNVPTKAGGQFMETPTPTTVLGVPISVGSSTAVVGGTTFAVGPGAPERTVVQHGQTITIGSGGVALKGTTILPPAAQPTNVVIIDGEVFSAIGSNTAVIGSRTIVYGPGTPTTTEMLNGETITIGPQGISFDGTTLGGAAHATGTQLGIAGGFSVTEIGSTLAIVNGHTFTLGPGAPQTTMIINGQTVTAGPSGLGFGGATLTYPFNVPTQAITAGGITFSEIGSSLVVIGSRTFTFGPGASRTTSVYNGQTISIGPGGVGFATTTFTGATAGATGAAGAQSTSKKNGAERLSFRGGIFGICFIAGVGFWL